MIKVITPGFYTTIQDLGRFGHQDIGVPISGAMDSYSAKRCNKIVGNDDNAAVLEITMTGPTLEFLKSTFICVSGADMAPNLNDIKIKQNTLVRIVAGDILIFGRLKSGFRTYLAISGGITSEVILSSRSMYQNITSKVRLKNLDELSIENSHSKINSLNTSLKVVPLINDDELIEVNKGPEYDQLTKIQMNQLENQNFTISKNNNRMAYQLNELLKNDLESIITSLVMPGTVQLTSSGQIIVLMRDCQTTGGYPRIFQLNESSINKLAQKTTSHTIRFKLLD